MDNSTNKITAASIYNNMVLGYIALIFHRSGLFSLLSDSTITEKQIITIYDYDPIILSDLLKVGYFFKILELQKNDTVAMTDLGYDLIKNIGFFTWFIGGYSPLFENANLLIKKGERDWKKFVRGDYVAIGSDEANEGLMKHIFEKFINTLDIKCAADLGCGNARRLVKMCMDNKDMKGIGIDISPAAIEVAQKNVDSSDLGNRIKLIRNNVFNELLANNSLYKEVDTVFSFMMLHDLFNIQELNGSLFEKLQKAFPNAHTFVFADTCLDVTSNSKLNYPIFTLGYEFSHTLRHIKLFKKEEYYKRIESEGMQIVREVPFGVPNTYLFIIKK
ncbi:MAG: methyltransferase domain-containing protein [Spirochaetes bacterium]|nr:methyltransferase domain-containing protein [Spirochaetota bacterium]